jgi:uncharacterized protein YndB with AHSA1/START domain
MNKGRIVPESALVFERTLPAPIGKVWEFLTDTARLPEWHGEGRIEPREGGTVSLMGGHIRGVVTVWRPQSALGYTWNVFQPGETASSSEALGQTKVSAWPVSYLEFALKEAGGDTALTLTHRPIPEAMQDVSRMGWHTMLELLEAGLRGEFLKSADLFPKNAALYGVDISKIKR